jgi:ubiquinone/menaquinone biosynthesis C-methylase UbiE
VPSPTSFREDPKRAAVDQWTADPCGPETASEPGTAQYAEELLAGRRGYAPWMDEVLGYDETSGLDVLDVGCGQGIDLARYARAGARATGIDLTPRHAELAAAHVAALRLDARVVGGDAERLPFGDASFDRVSSNGVLHHTPEFELALGEILRVLRPGGEVRVIVYNRSSLHFWLTEFLYLGLVKRHLLRERSMAGVLSLGVEATSVGARPLVRVYSPRALRRLLREAGFEDVRTLVRHLRPEDTPPLDLLARAVPRLRDPRLADRIGRVAGWYVTGLARKPAL